jgi:hypothetical protein
MSYEKHATPLPACLEPAKIVARAESCAHLINLSVAEGEHRAALRHVYLLGATEMLKRLHGQPEPDYLWGWQQDERDWSRRLRELYDRYSVAPPPPGPDHGRYCVCRRVDCWFGITSSVTATPVGEEEEDYIRLAWAYHGLILCQACGGVAPWRGETVGSMPLTGAAFVLRRHFHPDGRRREAPSSNPPALDATTTTSEGPNHE